MAARNSSFVLAFNISWYNRYAREYGSWTSFPPSSPKSSPPPFSVPAHFKNQTQPEANPLKSLKIYYNIPSNQLTSYCPRFSKITYPRFILRYTRLSRISYCPKFSRKIEIHANPRFVHGTERLVGGLAFKYHGYWRILKILFDKYKYTSYKYIDMYGYSRICSWYYSISTWISMDM